MSRYFGDFAAGAVVRIPFNTSAASGGPATLTSGAVTVSRDGSDVTPSGGVTLTTDAGGVTGRHSVAIDTSVDAGVFLAGRDYVVRLSGSSAVAGTSVVGAIVGAFSLANRAVAPQTGDAYARIGAAGAGLTAIGPVTLATSQPNYAPATATALASLVATVGAAGAGLTGLPPVTLATSQPNYAAAKESTLAGLVATVGTNGDGLTAVPDPAGVGTLLSRLTSTRAGYLDSIPSLATASQIPADFTSATFASAGVFSTEALANAPTGGGGGGPVQLAEDQPYYAPAKAGDAMALEAGERADLAAAILDLADGVESGETVRQTLRLLRAVLAGRAVAGTGTVAFRRKDGTTVALTVTHDDAGNRTASTVGTL